jgi:membrane-bound lytic murein transglycosylase B
MTLTTVFKNVAGTLLVFFGVFFLVSLNPALGSDLTFREKMNEFKKKALREGIPKPLIERTLSGVREDTSVLSNLRNQPEFTMDYPDYQDLFIDTKTVQKGRELIRENRELLKSLEEEYGIPAQILVAIWGIESHYGDHRSQHDVVRSISTLAFGNSGRNDYFQGELMAVLKILNRDLIPRSRLRGSWAGAMGQPQFMPSSYLEYAVDQDGNGNRDLWDNKEDILGSIANYLHRHGWQSDVPWGWPEDQPTSSKIRDTRRLKPKGSGREYVITENFDVIKRYNPSDHYALTVGKLSDRLEEEIKQ